MRRSGEETTVSELMDLCKKSDPEFTLRVVSPTGIKVIERVGIDKANKVLYIVLE